MTTSSFSFHRSWLVLLLISSFAASVAADMVSDLNSHGFQVLAQGGSGYADASAAFNQRLSFTPAAVTYPKTAADISAVLKIAQSYKYKTTARSGGHSYVANGIGGKNGVVVVDLKNFKNITVDSSTNVATIGAGNRLGPIAVALNAKGRALPHGTCPYVGIGGHAGYGGFGYPSRKWGLTLDNIVSLDAVLANGTIVNGISMTKYPDLFWALRGSSGSFGIVTTYRFKTYAAPSSVTTFNYGWNDITASQLSTLIQGFQSHFASTNVSADLGIGLTIGRGSKKGRFWVGMSGAWYAANSKFQATISPLLSKLPAASYVGDLTQRTYIGSVTQVAQGTPINAPLPQPKDTFYAKSLMTPQGSPIPSAAVTAFTTYLTNQGWNTSTSWWLSFDLYGGPSSAINKVASDATAFSRRNALFTIQFYASTSNSKPPFPQEGYTFLDGMVNSIVNNGPSGWNYGAYANYVDSRLTNWQSLYFASNYARLSTLKRQYDPKNTFNFPTSIEL